MLRKPNTSVNHVDNQTNAAKGAYSVAPETVDPEPPMKKGAGNFGFWIDEVRAQLTKSYERGSGLTVATISKGPAPEDVVVKVTCSSS